MKWWSGLDVWNDSLLEKLVTDWGSLGRRVLWTLWSICACTFVIINVSLKSKCFILCSIHQCMLFYLYIYIYLARPLKWISFSAVSLISLNLSLQPTRCVTPTSSSTSFSFFSNSKSHPTFFSHWISSFTLKNNICQTTESKTYRKHQQFLHIALDIKVSWNPKINFIWVMCAEHHRQQCYHPLILTVGEN